MLTYCMPVFFLDVNVFLPDLFRLFIFLLLSFKPSAFLVKFLYEMCLASVLSQLIVCLLMLLISSFTSHNFFLILMKHGFSTFFHVLCLLVCTLKSQCNMQELPDCLPCYLLGVLEFLSWYLDAFWVFVRDGSYVSRLNAIQFFIRIGTCCIY